MNDIEAIKTLESLYKFEHNLTPEQENAIEIAKEALQEKAERENAEPLTLEQLNERTGKPVWIKHIPSPCNIKDSGEWRILKPCDLTVERPFVEFENGGLCAYYYGQGWLAYDYEPKEDICYK